MFKLGEQVSVVLGQKFNIWGKYICSGTLVILDIFLLR